MSGRSDLDRGLRRGDRVRYLGEHDVYGVLIVVEVVRPLYFTRKSVAPVWP